MQFSFTSTSTDVLRQKLSLLHSPEYKVYMLTHADNISTLLNLSQVTYAALAPLTLTTISAERVLEYL